MISIITSTFVCATEGESREKALQALKVAAYIDIALGIIFFVLGIAAAAGGLPPIGAKIFFPLAILSVLLAIGILRELPELKDTPIPDDQKDPEWVKGPAPQTDHA